MPKNKPEGPPTESFHFHHFPRLGATLCVSAPDETGKVKTGLALCREGDNFSKERGRIISHGRAVRQRGKLSAELPASIVREAILCTRWAENNLMQISATNKKRMSAMPTEQKLLEPVSVISRSISTVKKRQGQMYRTSCLSALLSMEQGAMLLDLYQPATAEPTGEDKDAT